MSVVGNDIQELLNTAQHDVLIVAPFIRKEALARLLECIPVGVEKTVVTRWRLADLLAGASDLDTYDAAESNGAALFLRNDLHAKLFAADDRCLVGSANVTQTALGWRTPANLELAVAVARSASEIVEFERQLLSGAVRATVVQRDRLATLLEQLKEAEVTLGGGEHQTSGQLRLDWVPRIRNPEELYAVYQGDTDVGRSSLPLMRHELVQIGVVPGLSEEVFREWVAAAISQTPLVEGVWSLIEKKGEVSESDLSLLMARIGGEATSEKPRDVLEALERWLTYFVRTQRYETVRDSIKLIKAKRL